MMARVQTPVPQTHAEVGRIEERVDFERIRYANCWEDADVLCDALRVRPGMRVLSIASAGDNALALLGTGAEVVAADLSSAQLACLELRCAAFRSLSYEELLKFLGVRPCTERLATFERIANRMSSEARTFWRRRRVLLESGAIHVGKFEAYFRLFRRRVLPWIHRRRTIDALLCEKSAAERAEFWNTRWNNRRWRFLFRLFFSRRVMGCLGRDPEFFRYVEGSVADRLLSRTESALTRLPTHANPYLQYIATGGFRQAFPRYLRREHFDSIRAGLDRLTLFHGSIEQAARQHGAHGRGFDAFNLSDIFEYVDAPLARRLYGELLEAAVPGARLAYWNTLVSRTLAEDFPTRVRSLTELSAQLFQRDQAFFYCHFQVDERRDV